MISTRSVAQLEQPQLERVESSKVYVVYNIMIYDDLTGQKLYKQYWFCIHR